MEIGGRIMDWLVKLDGERSDLVGLPSLLHTSKLTVVEEGDSYYLRSTDFLQLDSPDKVQERAKAIIDVINEVQKLDDTKYLGITEDGVILIDGDGNRQHVHCVHDPTKLGEDEE